MSAAKVQHSPMVRPSVMEPIQPSRFTPYSPPLMMAALVRVPKTSRANEYHVKEELADDLVGIDAY